MLKITVEETQGRVVRLALEGKLASAWVGELEAVWERLMKEGEAPAAVRIDLRGLDYVSPQGKDLLAKLSHAGAHLIAGDCMTKGIVQQILGGLAAMLFVFAGVGGVARGQDAAPLKLTLRDAVKVSLKQNPEVILANLNVDTSVEDKKLARSALLPQVGAGFSDKLTRANVETAFGQSIPIFPQHIGPFYTIQAGVSGSVPLFDLTLWRRYQSSKQDIATSEAGEKTTREQATLLVVSQYLGAQRAAADVKAAQSRVDLAQALYDQAADLLKAGAGTRIDSLRADVELKNEAQRLIQAKTQNETALYALQRLLGIEATHTVVLADDLQFFETPELDANQSLQLAYSTRPEMLEIHSRQKAVSLDRKAAGAERLPTVHLDGAWSQEGLTPSRMIPVYQYGVSLQVPLFTGGRIAAEETKADIELKKLGQQEIDLRNRISVEVKTAGAQLDSARNEVQVANAALALANEEVTQARDRFQAGVTNNIEVISAQDALSRAYDNQIAALYRFNQARADLAHSAGSIESLYSR
jgi:outer membrane protein TolC